MSNNKEDVRPKAMTLWEKEREEESFLKGMRKTTARRVKIDQGCT